MGRAKFGSVVASAYFPLHLRNTTAATGAGTPQNCFERPLPLDRRAFTPSQKPAKLVAACLTSGAVTGAATSVTPYNLAARSGTAQGDPVEAPVATRWSATYLNKLNDASADGFSVADVELLFELSWYADKAGSEQIVDLDWVSILSGAVVNLPGVPSSGSPSGGSLGGQMTTFPGPITGFVTAFPIPAVNATTGLTDGVIREIEIPFDFRIQGILLSTAASGAGNTMRVLNATTAVALCAQTAMVAAAPASVFIPASSCLNRNLKRGDKIHVEVDTGGTGITQASVILIGQPTGHIAEPRRLLASGHGGANDRPMNEILSHLSGPAVGGLMGLTLPGKDSATTGTNAPLAQVIAPCNLNVLDAYYASLSGAIDTAYRLYNVTQSVAVLTVTATLATEHYQSVAASATGTIDNPLVNKDDVLELQITPGSTTASVKPVLTLIAQTTDHVNDFPRYD
jgi:hypothetical protein